MAVHFKIDYVNAKGWKTLTIELDVLKDRAIKSGFDFIDFWAVDFDWHKGIHFQQKQPKYCFRGFIICNNATRCLISLNKNIA